jgi:hypothetical protein
MGEKQVIVISDGDDPPSISTNFLQSQHLQLFPQLIMLLRKPPAMPVLTIKGYAVPAFYKTFPPEESPEGKSTGGNAMREWQSLAHVKWECKYHVVGAPK